MGTRFNDSTARIEKVEVSVYKVPTDSPESDGTYTWVDLGSQTQFDRDHKLDFKNGERIKVTGARLVLVRATEVQVGDRTITTNAKSFHHEMHNLKENVKETGEKIKEKVD